MVQLPESLLRYLQDLPTRFPQIEKIVLFGSRSLGNGKPGSDVDLAFYGKEFNASTLSKFTRSWRTRPLFLTSLMWFMETN